MPISFQELRAMLKTLEPGLKTYRDAAPSNAKYPYIIYEFVNEQQKRLSNKVMADMPLYQITYVTTGIESELSILKTLFQQNMVPYEGFVAMESKENDVTVTEFTTYVRCINE